ncbi:hypothetical protein Gpo141_00009722, partial [Globisporangium polare]
MYVVSTANLQQLLAYNANHTLVDPATHPIVAVHFHKTPENAVVSASGASAIASKLVAVTITLGGSRSAYSAIILRLSAAMNQVFLFAVLSELLEDAAVIKVLSCSVKKTIELVHSGSGGKLTKPASCVDLHKLLKQASTENDPEVSRLRKYFADSSAENPHHAAMNTHLQKNPKAWSQPILAKKLLQYADYEANKYLECYSYLVRKRGINASEAAQVIPKQQSKATAPAPVAQVQVQPPTTASKAPSRTTTSSSSNSGGAITYVNTTAELNGLIQSRGCELFQVSRTPIV